MRGEIVESVSPDTPRWRWLDRSLLALLALYGAFVLAMLLTVPHLFLPAEDAVILYQYSQNLAHHGAITYYAGGPHAEGATDFAWMVLIAGAIKLGADPFVLVAVVNFLSLPLLALALLRLGRARITPLRVLAIAGAAGLLPQILAAGAGFSVLPNALLLVLLVLAVERQQAVAASLLGLVLCLFRPDGVVFALPLLGSLLLAPTERWQRARVIAGLFVLPGLAYFAWRAHYFGELFPLPFLVKSDTHRALGLVVARSFLQSTKYLLFDTVLLLPVLFRQPLTPRLRRLLVAVVLLPTLFFWAMRLDQNVGDRFFFYLPLASALVIALCWTELDTARRRMALYAGIAAWLLFLRLPFLREIRTFRDYQFQDVQAIAQDLKRLPTRGSLLTTEAGLLTYGSGWVAYDAWGLNTAKFARHPIQAEDVAALRPDLIAFHPDPDDSCVPRPSWPASSSTRSWKQMTHNMVRGAAGYELWLLSYGSPFYRQRQHWGYGEGDRECFLVKSDSPLHDGIVASLAKHHAVGPPQSTMIEEKR
jgi:hypothetical protein